ncbi:putative ABC transport system ATP-binding protein [Evansella vedderi]|uniref:ABC transport system ATP-binding protein n=1 Tax=Evansella vedderi TaxID=38282 RepID=A0ABT9ZTU2_9BACI|nr:ATP-binding cassette domain-containing protein [Evansella vedderi]MDQ0253898.1 putative ABC transport system ATP-binding protein [Evansella vedderi]
MYAVSLTNVLKRFSNGSEMKVLFENMDFHVTEGELVVISGGEKTGKSTLLRMIAAMTPPNKGTVKVLGKDLLALKKRPEWRLDNIGYITNEGALIPYLTPKQNLLLGIEADDPIYRVKENEAEQILLDLGFTFESMNETLEGLSSKDQILATIARIFMTNPKLILADEPTKELTGNEGNEVLTQLFRFARKKGSTIIVISNDPTIIEEADRFYKLKNCQLSEEKNEAV